MFLADHHPIWPVVALVSFSVCVAALAWKPGIWLFVVPAGLPWLNFSPWTGWLIFEEFDLLLLAVFAGVYARMAWAPGVALVDGRYSDVRPWTERHAWSDVVALVLLTALGISGVVGLSRGVGDAGGFSFGWFQGYTDPLNSLRIFKSLFFAYLTIPLLWDAMRHSPNVAGRRLGLGMVFGLAVVALAALWERAAYPGVLDLDSVYRVTALFWEMHVGGGAIDAYLAMAMPFVLWALFTATGRLAWAMSAALAVLAVYACLVTFSRGVYVAVGVSLVCGFVFHSIRGKHAAAEHQGASSFSAGVSGRRRKAGVVLSALIAVLVGTVLIGSALWAARWARTDRDIGSRLARWHDGAGLVNRGTERWLGVGLGRLPASYARRVPNRRKLPSEFSGRVEVMKSSSGSSSGVSFARISGPATVEGLGGLFSLTQRVPAGSSTNYRVRLDFEAAVATRMEVRLCERHLLYDWYCQSAELVAEGRPGHLQHWSSPLSGDELDGGPWYAPRLAMLSLSTLDQGRSIDLYQVSLINSNNVEQLVNRSFSEDLAHWFPAAQYYFLPWHIDSIYVESLIERGLIGLFLFVATALAALDRVLRCPRDSSPLASYVAASLVGALLVGSVSSFLDAPRVAFLFFLLIFFAFSRPRSNRISKSFGASG